MLPVSELNRLRRELVNQATALSQGETVLGERWICSVPSMLEAVWQRRDPAALAEAPSLRVLCRDVAQIDAALDAGVTRLYADFEDIRLYGDIVERVRSRGGAEIWLATPRIQKSGEAGLFKLISRARPDGVLIRNLGAIAFFRGEDLPVTGDFSLNVANPLTAEFLKDTGLRQLTVSYDLNIEQVLDLLRAAPPEWFELTLHQHMPMFHMEHCAFAAFLSDGTDFTNCGRPCEKHRVRLRDRVGMEHPLKADVGCRNTLFNAVAQTGAQFHDELLAAGLRAFRIELLEEDAAQAVRTIRAYQDLLAGRRRGEDLWRDLRAQSQLGVTRGTLAELV
jgi:putative protease